ALSGSATFALYVQYTFSAPNLPEDYSMTWLTAPFVGAAVLRYYWVARTNPARDAEEIAFRDPVTLVLVVGFVVVAVTRLLFAS
ncbi:MAG: decaprenyl-phosphate phosphoribosyltransferase, partial [Dehalococcoidia bacterium]|nr:decaprenyl-phosphate phosphoribosyltransferase [Dehalococcoidia bacterium]